MMGKIIPAVEAPAPVLPAWAQTVREKYLAGESSTFVLHRNVFDTILFNGRMIDLKEFIERAFSETKKTMVEVSLEFGAKILFGPLLVGQEEGGGLPGALLEQLHQLEAHLRISSGTIVYVPYADVLIPDDEGGFVGAEERKVATLFHRWSLDRSLNARDNITFIVVESLVSLNQALLTNPKVSAIEIPMPDETTRLGMVQHLAPTLPASHARLYANRMAGLRCVQIEGLMKASSPASMDEVQREQLILELLKGCVDSEARAKQFASITAGMTAQEIGKLVEPTKAIQNEDPSALVLKLIHVRKRELIEKECAGLIEFVEPKHDMAAVGGIDHIRAELEQIAKNLREGNTRMCPMGLLAVGPMGAGKTFVLKAFLKEAGISAVALKNFRSKWVGSTERNLERVLATVKAMGPIAVLIDEGDRSFGNAGGEGGDDGTSSRVIGRLKEFMSDTDNRGQVLFILLTNRPDKLDTDIKRPGRLDRKIPFFYAENAEERADIVRALAARYGIDESIDQGDLLFACSDMAGYSNADLEAVVLLAIEFKHRDPDLSAIEALVAAAKDFMPPQERDMIDFMELLAVSETSRRSLLPERFREMSLEDIQAKLTSSRAAALLR